MTSTSQGAPGMAGLIPGSHLSGLPPIPAVNGSKADEGPQGVKRRRDDDSDEESGEKNGNKSVEKGEDKSDGEDAPMEEDDDEDDDVSMAASSESEE